MPETQVTSISDIVTLADRMPNITTLKHSIDPACPLVSQSRGSTLTGNVSEDRTILIAIFPLLGLLNGTEVRPKERDEAERRFLQILDKRPRPDLSSPEWRAYDRLAKKHGQASNVVREGTPTSSMNPRSLKSKLISMSSTILFHTPLIALIE